MDPIEMLARMWMTCDPNRSGSDPDEPITMTIDGEKKQVPNWQWFIPRAEESLAHFAKHGFELKKL